MSIYQIAYKPNGYRAYAYIGLPPSLRIRPHEVQRLFDTAPDHSFIGRVRLVAADWARAGQCERRAERDGGCSRYPVLVYCRGGIGRIGKVRKEWIHDFASRGFVVAAPCYRGAEGGEGKDGFGGSENEDVVSLMDSVAMFPFVDINRITMMGFSRGAINAAQTCIASRLPKRLIVWGGVSDLVATYDERPSLRRMLERITGGAPDSVPFAYEARSPIHLIHDIRCPTLIVHGTQDVQVNVSHATRLYQTLVKAQKPVTMHLYDGLGHHLPHRIHQAVVDRMTDWIHSVQDTTNG